MAVRLLLLLLCVARTLYATHDETLVDHRFFLQQIFDKYGHSGIMSFEGFEHLMENLGLGHLEFDTSHNVSLHRVNGTFREVHDSLALHRHDHRETGRDRRTAMDLDGALEELLSAHAEGDLRQLRAPPTTRRCLSPGDILLTYGLEPHHAVAISPLKFLHLCPAIVYELDQRSCYSVDDVDKSDDDQQEMEQSSGMAWQYASLSVLVISLTGLLGVAVVPLVHKTFYHHILNFLVALAVGTLVGDALLHLLPHALLADATAGDHTTPVLRSSVVLIAILFFFFVETVLRRMTTKTVSHNNETNSSPVVNQLETLPYNGEAVPVMEAGMIPKSYTIPQHHHQHHHHHHHNHQMISGDTLSLRDPIPVKNDTSIRSVAWMVIMGDGLHNITDGLAIGAAFSGNTVAGVATSLAVFCHELPHELGDFAVLLKSGMSVRHAVFYNILSSILSFMGMAAGVWLGNYETASFWIYSFTAGTFLYISLVDLIPEMNSYIEEAQTIMTVLLQISGILIGGGIMLVIALYEDSFHTMFSTS